jgi:hypothetical protein
VRLDIPRLGLAGIVGLSLLAAGCGGSSGAKVAQVGSTPTTTTGAGSSGRSKLDAEVTYAACMRKHGVPEFPDPNVSGSDTGPSGGMSKGAPQFKSAERACQKLLPNGGVVSPQEQAKLLRQALAYAACMRGHGVPTFPDPTEAADGNPDFGQIGPSVWNSPQLEPAQKACHKLLPGSPTGAGPGTS